MDVSSVLLGAGIALGSAALGVLSEAAKGWLTRRTTIEDKRTSFLHATAIELQETLYEYVRTTMVMYLEDVASYRQSGRWTRDRVSHELDETNRGLAHRVSVLVERIDDPSVREAVEATRSAANTVGLEDSYEKATMALDQLFDTMQISNRELGKQIRRSWPA